MTCTPEEREAYCNALEDRCQHFEETINSTVGLLQAIIQDFEASVLNSMLSPIIERLNSLIVFLEATSASAPNPHKYYSLEE
jgi:hypothetical protein